MGFKALKQKRWFRILSNKYLLILLVFAVWMFFLDSNSWLVQHKLQNKIDKLQGNKAYYHREIKKDSTVVDELSDPEGLERFAREEYYMKRKNEAIYLIDFKDSLNGKQP